MVKSILIKPISNQLVITVHLEYCGNLIEESVILPNTNLKLTATALENLLTEGDLKSLFRQLITSHENLSRD